ncbi:hypothetical protein Unana1_00900 [Umbelopsis nana]
MVTKATVAREPLSAKNVTNKYQSKISKCMQKFIKLNGKHERYLLTFCATATGETKDPTGAAQILIPLIQSLQQQLNSKPSNPVLNLCVDETTARIRSLGEFLYDIVEGRYDLDWCIKAVQTEKEDMTKAKDWVENNAPLPK